jgi:hypothetical protein
MIQELSIQALRNAESHITVRAPKIADAMSSLTGILSARWDVLYREQGSGRRLQSARSLLWSPVWGWEMTPGNPAQTYRSGYIHLDMALASHPDIGDAVTRVIDACR